MKDLKERFSNNELSQKKQKEIKGGRSYKCMEVVCEPDYECFFGWCEYVGEPRP